MQASRAVTVVPMLSPRRTGTAPARPSTLWMPSGPACPGHVLQQRDGGRTALHYHGHGEAQQDAQKRRLLHPGHPVEKDRLPGQRLQSPAQNVDAFEEQPEGEHRLAHGLPAGPAGREVEEKARNSTGYTSVWTSKAMSCAVHGGADVDAVDDGHRRGSSSSPALTKPMTITVAAELLWSTAVTASR